jgi:hypothetical protein
MTSKAQKQRSPKNGKNGHTRLKTTEISLNVSSQVDLLEKPSGVASSAGTPVVIAIGDSVPPLYVIYDLVKTVRELRSELGKHATVSCTFITTLGVPELSLSKAIPVTVRQEDGTFIASFLDANIGSGGETLADAIASLQSAIVDSFNHLADVPDDKLWPPMLKTKRVLLETVCRN